jgi:hypothetical protein
MKISAGKVVLSLSAPIKSHMYRHTFWNFESKERLHNVRVLRHCIHQLQSCHFVSTPTLTLQPSKPPIQCTRGAIFLGSKDLNVKLVTSYYIFIARCLIQKKITFYCNMHWIILHYFQVSTPIFLWPFAAIYLFMGYCITYFLFGFFLSSPIICPLLFSLLYLF